MSYKILTLIVVLLLSCKCEHSVLDISPKYLVDEGSGDVEVYECSFVDGACVIVSEASRCSVCGEIVGQTSRQICGDYTIKLIE